LNIYIYGTEKFKTKVRFTLTKANLEVNIESINTLFKLQTTIENNPNEIFIIDESKIIESNMVTKYFQFLSPKDGIKREFIEKYGIGDVCFNSISGMIGYIKSRINQEFEEKKKSIIEVIASTNDLKNNTVDFVNNYEDEKQEEKIEEIEEIQEVRNLASLRKIEEILSDEIENKMFLKTDNNEDKKA